MQGDRMSIKYIAIVPVLRNGRPTNNDLSPFFWYNPLNYSWYKSNNYVVLLFKVEETTCIIDSWFLEGLNFEQSQTLIHL